MRSRFREAVRSLWDYPPAIRAMFAGWVISLLGRSMIIPFLAIFFHDELGLSMAQVGVVYLIMGAARTFGRLISGTLIDRWGCRKVLILPSFLRAAGFLVLAGCVHVAAPFAVMVLLLCVTDFLGAFFESASDTYVADTVPLDERPHVYGFLRVGLNMGWMIGPAIGAFLARTPFSLLFLLTSLCLLAVPPLMIRHCPETRGPGMRAATGQTPAFGLFAFGEVARNRLFVGHCLFSLCHFVLTSQLVSTLSVYATGVVGISRVQLGWTYTLNGLLVMLFQMPMNRLLARVPLGRRLSIGAFFYGCGYFSLAFVPNWSWLLASMVVISVSEMAAEPAAVSLVSHLAPREALGRFMGMYGFVRSVAYSIGPFLGGCLYDRFAAAPAVLWGALAAYALAAAGGFLALSRAMSTCAPSLPGRARR